MKIEMFEKIGEINVVELRPASENRAIANAELARKAEEERIRKEQEEREKARIANEVLAKLVKAINDKSEIGGQYLHLEWRSLTKSYGISFSEYCTAFDYIKPILESAGYDVRDIYFYSDSWTYRSGKLGYAYIWWDKQK